MEWSGSKQLLLTRIVWWWRGTSTCPVMSDLEGLDKYGSIRNNKSIGIVGYENQLPIKTSINSTLLDYEIIDMEPAFWGWL